MTLENGSQGLQGVGQNQQAPERTLQEFKTILGETLPCWHELSWESEEVALVLRIHQSYADAITIKPDAPIVLGFQETFGLGNFNGDLRGNFGFNEALRNRGEKDGFYEFAIELPRIERATREPRLNWRRAHEISTSLDILTMRLHDYDHEVPTIFPQLITFEASGSPKHSALFGEIGIPLRRWLSSKPDHSLVPDAVAAMKAAHVWMFGAHGSLASHFEMRIKDKGGLIASCPGEGCGIYPVDWNFREGRGYRFTSHNVNNPAQQLTLLAGLAALHDIARREISR